MTRQSLNSLVLMRPAAGNVRHQGRHKPLRAVKERLLPRLLLPRLLQSLQLPDVHRAPVGFEWLVIGIERVR